MSFRMDFLVFIVTLFGVRIYQRKMGRFTACSPFIYAIVVGIPPGRGRGMVKRSRVYLHSFLGDFAAKPPDVFNTHVNSKF